MAEECTATSAVTSSSSPPTPHSWWDLYPANSLSSWSDSITTNVTSWHHNHHQNPNSNPASNCEQDDLLSISTSLTNVSNHSGLTVESSGGRVRQLVDQPVPPTSINASDNHLWSHVLSNGDMRNPDVGDNLFEAISSKSTSSAGIFEPACDYLKKIDHGNWEFPNSSVFNNNFKILNGFDTNGTDQDHQSSIESERLTKLSNLVSNWSIAPPDPQVNPQFINPKSCDHISLTSNSVENYSQSQQPPDFCGMATIKNPVRISCYDNGNYHRHDVKMETQSLDIEAPTSYFRRAFKGTNSNGYHHHNNLINNSISMEADNFYGSILSNSPCSNTLTYSRLSKPLVDIHASKPSFRPSSLSDCKKQALQAANSQQTRNSNGRTQRITNEGKKKRGDQETSDSLKKPKLENSTASSVKMQAPKVKLGDRITALQQIVSPFGKTDTASVLKEAIGYINFLQEQVQLLSNPYMKPNIYHKDPWGSLDQKGDIKVDLRNRGLCLVPISCTPQVYHESSSTGSDYWTPTYKGCLYR